MDRIHRRPVLKAGDAEQYLAIDPQAATSRPVITLAAFPAGDVGTMDLANYLAPLAAPGSDRRTSLVERVCILPAPAGFITGDGIQVSGDVK